MKVIDAIAAEAGFDVASTICQIWGDQTLYIPDNPGPDHPIAQDIGYENLLKVVATFGGQTIHPPNMNRSHLAQRARARCLKREGLSERRIAWILNVSQTRIERLLAGCNANEEWHEWAESEAS